VHRDLKPENILLQKKGEVLSVKIADFGFAKFLDADPDHLTSTGLGTFGYVAPEIIERKTRYDGLMCDCWSLGIILYILIAGDAPFKLGGASKADKAKVLHGSYKFGKQWDKVSDGPRNVVKNLLIVNPRKRWTAKQCCEDNWVYHDGQPVDGWTYGAEEAAVTTVDQSGLPKAHKQQIRKEAEEEPGCGCGQQ